MKTLLILPIFIILIVNQTVNSQSKSIYDFKMPSLTGENIDFSTFKGKKILIVNTASKCGFTPQYKDLEALNKKYGSSLVIIGFPANNFGQQEPGSNQEIKEFCTKNYGVSFIMAAKVSVKGEDIDPFFKWLIAINNPDFTGDIKWNFEKFLFDEQGRLIHRFRSNVNPMDKQIIENL
jgi:glutathione peroxidase